ncbi:hypothetical protein FOL47_000105 [Perkinsus chesapeaki]|uniref:Uncharacterized protein n=1 Tax=Perkinsus chesapeaki TaxID=330153 RepID=A0A7J6N1B8_PERCH|nr:hypothetical protein FOL47_000105 [Perkinsus chesapeaki]
MSSPAVIAAVSVPKQVSAVVGRHIGLAACRAQQRSEELPEIKRDDMANGEMCTPSSSEVTMDSTVREQLQSLARSSVGSQLRRSAHDISGLLNTQHLALQEGIVHSSLLAATIDALSALSPADVSVDDIRVIVGILSKVGVNEPHVLYKLRHLWLARMSEMDSNTIVSILHLLGHTKAPDHELFLTASEILQLSADTFTLPQCVSLLRSCARSGEFHVRLFHCIFARIVTLLPTASKTYSVVWVERLVVFIAVTVHACGAILDSMAILRARDDRVVLATALKLNHLLTEGREDPDHGTLTDLRHISLCLRALSKLGFVQPSTMESLMGTCRSCLTSASHDMSLDLASLLSHSINRLGLYDPMVAWQLLHAVDRCIDRVGWVEEYTEGRLSSALSACYLCPSAFPEEVQHHFQTTAVKIARFMIQRHKDNGTQMKSRTKASLHMAMMATLPREPHQVVLEAAELDPSAIVTSSVEESSSGLMKEVLRSVKDISDMDHTIHEEVHAPPFSIDLVLSPDHNRL